MNRPVITRMTVLASTPVPAQRAACFAPSAMRTLIPFVLLCCLGAHPAQAQNTKEPKDIKPTQATQATQAVIAAGNFSQLAPGGTPPDWKPLTFRNIDKHTVYILVKDGSTTVLKADSNASASGLTRDLSALNLNIRDTPILKWRWKIANLVKSADIDTKEGDDYPARVYVTFRYDPERAGAGMRMQYGLAKTLYGEYPPHAGINYVWDGKAPVGTITPNAYTARAMMFVVESGAKRVGEWVEVERNVYEDYKRAFKEEPPSVLGIAVMTDTDSTGEAAVAWYGDITLHKKP